MVIRKSRTPPYHPQGDPQPECLNQTLLSILGTLGREKKCSWSQHVSYLVHAYNSTKCDATGYSSYHLIFGREARLPVDVCFGTSPNGTKNACHTRYVTKEENLKQAYKLASDAADKRHQTNLRLYDRRVTFQTIDIGDRASEASTSWRVSATLPPCCRWKNAKPTCVQGQEGGWNTGSKTIHRDHLLPIGQHVSAPSSDQVEDPPARPKTRAVIRRESQREARPEIQEYQEFCDLFFDMEYYVTHSANWKDFVPRLTIAPKPVVDTEPSLKNILIIHLSFFPSVCKYLKSKQWVNRYLVCLHLYLAFL